MAMATDFSGDSLNSLEFRGNLRPPWVQVARGEPSSISTVDESPVSSTTSMSSMIVSVTEAPLLDGPPAKSDPPSPPPDNLAFSGSYGANDDNATAPTERPAWNKPSNGVVAAGHVMGAVSWPALSKSARSSSKLAVDSLVNPASEEPVPTNQVSHSALPQRQAANNAKSNSIPKHPVAARQRSSRRGGGGGGGGSSVGGPSRGGFTRQPSPPPPPSYPVYPIPPRSYFNLMPAIPDPSSGEPLFRGNNWDPRPVQGFAPQTNAAANHRNFFNRVNFAFHPRSDGPYHNNRGGRHEQDRGIYPNGRDVHLQQHRPPTRGFMRPSPSNTAQFPQPVRPHGNSVVHPVLYLPPMPFEPYRGMPYMPRPATYAPVADPLSVLLVKQIDYYFSDANLIKDEYLRSNMDDQGWIPVSLIASFPRVMSMTNDLQFIVDSLRASTVVEVRGDRIRRRNDWMRWTSINNRLGTDSASSSSGESGQDKLVTSLQRMKVDEEGKSRRTTGNIDPNTGIPSPGAADQSQLINGEEVNKEVHSNH